MTNNKGPVINGEQLVTLINAIQSNALVGVDFEAFSKELIKRKFQLVKQDLDILFDRTQERVFELSKDTRKITFDIGEHASKYINLGITLLFISNSNTKLNKEVTINIPKSLFIHFLTSKEPIIEPSYSILSTNDIDVEVFYNVSVFSKDTGETVKVLTLDMETSNLNIYDEIKVIVDTLANDFKEIDTTPLTLTQELVRRKSIKKNVNIGYYPYAVEDGTLVRSDIVRHITCRTHDEMENIINNNQFSPSEFSLVPIEEDTSNRILEIQIKTYEPNTTITLTSNESQSKIFKANWGDGTEDTRIRHKYATAGTYTIKIYNRLDDFRLDSTSNQNDILSFQVPEGYVSPLEWNNTVVEGFVNWDRIAYKSESFKGNIFLNANKVKVMKRFVKSETINHVDPNVFNGLEKLEELEVMDLFRHVISVEENIFQTIKRIKKLTNTFKDSTITSLPSGLLKELEDLEDISSFAENSSLASIGEGLFNETYSIKVLRSAFKNTDHLTVDVTPVINQLLDHRTITSLESTFEHSGCTINISADIVNKLNKLQELSSLASAFKQSKVKNETIPFKLSRLKSLTTIESMFEGCSTFNVNSALLEDCSNPSGKAINVNNSLKGTKKVLHEINSDDDLFISTSFNGTSGLFGE